LDIFERSGPETTLLALGFLKTEELSKAVFGELPTPSLGAGRSSVKEWLPMAGKLSRGVSAKH